MGRGIVSTKHDMESPDLERLEAIVESGLQTFVEVGLALAEIRDRKLYLFKNGGEYQDFDTYCRERWGWSRQRTHQLIGSASVVESMSTMVDTPTPTTERAARELIDVPAEKRGEVMKKAKEAAAPKEPTAKDVAKAAKPYVPMAERIERAEKAAAAKAKRDDKKPSGAETRGAPADEKSALTDEQHEVRDAGQPEAGAVQDRLTSTISEEARESSEVPATEGLEVPPVSPSVPETSDVQPNLGTTAVREGGPVSVVLTVLASLPVHPQNPTTDDLAPLSQADVDRLLSWGRWAQMCAARWSLLQKATAAA